MKELILNFIILLVFEQSDKPELSRLYLQLIV